MGWVSVLVDETSILVGLQVNAVDLIKFKHKVWNNRQMRRGARYE